MTQLPSNGSEELLRQKIKSINRLTDYRHTPMNVVLVTVEDIIELSYEVAPYSMDRVDELTKALAQKDREILEARRTDLQNVLDTYNYLEEYKADPSINLKAGNLYTLTAIAQLTEQINKTKE